MWRLNAGTHTISVPGREGETTFRHSWSTFTMGLGTLDWGGSKITSRVTARWGFFLHLVLLLKKKAPKKDPRPPLWFCGWGTQNGSPRDSRADSANTTVAQGPDNGGGTGARITYSIGKEISAQRELCRATPTGAGSTAGASALTQECLTGPLQSHLVGRVPCHPPRWTPCARQRRPQVLQRMTCLDELLSQEANCQM